MYSNGDDYDFYSERSSIFFREKRIESSAFKMKIKEETVETPTESNPLSSDSFANILFSNIPQCIEVGNNPGSSAENNVKVKDEPGFISPFDYESGPEQYIPLNYDFLEPKKEDDKKPLHNRLWGGLSPFHDTKDTKINLTEAQPMIRAIESPESNDEIEFLGSYRRERGSNNRNKTNPGSIQIGQSPAGQEYSDDIEILSLEGDENNFLDFTENLLGGNQASNATPSYYFNEANQVSEQTPGNGRGTSQKLSDDGTFIGSYGRNSAPRNCSSTTASSSLIQIPQSPGVGNYSSTNETRISDKEEKAFLSNSYIFGEFGEENVLLKDFEIKKEVINGTHKFHDKEANEFTDLKLENAKITSPDLINNANFVEQGRRQALPGGYNVLEASTSSPQMPQSPMIHKSTYPEILALGEQNNKFHNTNDIFETFSPDNHFSGDYQRNNVANSRYFTEGSKESKQMGGSSRRTSSKLSGDVEFIGEYPRQNLPRTSNATETKARIFQKARSPMIQTTSNTENPSFSGQINDFSSYNDIFGELSQDYSLLENYQTNNGQNNNRFNEVNKIKNISKSSTITSPKVGNDAKIIENNQENMSRDCRDIGTNISILQKPQSPMFQDDRTTFKIPTIDRRKKYNVYNGSKTPKEFGQDNISRDYQRNNKAQNCWIKGGNKLSNRTLGNAGFHSSAKFADKHQERKALQIGNAKKENASTSQLAQSRMIQNHSIAPESSISNGHRNNFYNYSGTSGERSQNDYQVNVASPGSYFDEMSNVALGRPKISAPELKDNSKFIGKNEKKIIQSNNNVNETIPSATFIPHSPMVQKDSDKERDNFFENNDTFGLFNEDEPLISLSTNNATSGAFLNGKNETNQIFQNTNNNSIELNDDSLFIGEFRRSNVKSNGNVKEMNMNSVRPPQYSRNCDSNTALKSPIFDKEKNRFNKHGKRYKKERQNKPHHQDYGPNDVAQFTRKYQNQNMSPKYHLGETPVSPIRTPQALPFQDYNTTPKVHRLEAQTDKLHNKRNIQGEFSQDNSSLGKYQTNNASPNHFFNEVNKQTSEKSKATPPKLNHNVRYTKCRMKELPENSNVSETNLSSILTSPSTSATVSNKFTLDVLNDEHHGGTNHFKESNQSLAFAKKYQDNHTTPGVYFNKTNENLKQASRKYKKSDNVSLHKKSKKVSGSSLQVNKESCGHNLEINETSLVEVAAQYLPLQNIDQSNNKKSQVENPSILLPDNRSSKAKDNLKPETVSNEQQCSAKYPELQNLDQNHVKISEIKDAPIPVTLDKNPIVKDKIEEQSLTCAIDSNEQQCAASFFDLQNIEQNNKKVEMKNSLVLSTENKNSNVKNDMEEKSLTLANDSNEHQCGVKLPDLQNKEQDNDEKLEMKNAFIPSTEGEISNIKNDIKEEPLTLPNDSNEYQCGVKLPDLQNKEQDNDEKLEMKNAFIPSTEGEISSIKNDIKEEPLTFADDSNEYQCVIKIPDLENIDQNNEKKPEIGNSLALFTNDNSLKTTDTKEPKSSAFVKELQGVPDEMPILYPETRLPRCADFSTESEKVKREQDIHVEACEERPVGDIEVEEEEQRRQSIEAQRSSQLDDSSTVTITRSEKEHEDGSPFDSEMPELFPLSFMEMGNANHQVPKKVEERLQSEKLSDQSDLRNCQVGDNHQESYSHADFDQNEQEISAHHEVDNSISLPQVCEQKDKDDGHNDDHELTLIQENDTQKIHPNQTVSCSNDEENLAGNQVNENLNDMRKSPSMQSEEFMLQLELVKNCKGLSHEKKLCDSRQEDDCSKNETNAHSRNQVTPTLTKMSENASVQSNARTETLNALIDFTPPPSAQEIGDSKQEDTCSENGGKILSPNQITVVENVVVVARSTEPVKYTQAPNVLTSYTPPPSEREVADSRQYDASPNDRGKILDHLVGTVCLRSDNGIQSPNVLALLSSPLSERETRNSRQEDEHSASGGESSSRNEMNKIQIDTEKTVGMLNARNMMPWVVLKKYVPPASEQVVDDDGQKDIYPQADSCNQFSDDIREVIVPLNLKRLQRKRKRSRKPKKSQKKFKTCETEFMNGTPQKEWEFIDQKRNGMPDYASAGKKNKIQYQCEQCQKIYVREHYFLKHTQSHRNNDFRCKDCGKNFATKSALGMHSKTHTAKMFVCNPCEKVYVRQWNYDKHMKTHIILKFFLCSNCKRVFRTKIDRNNHLRKHLKYSN